MNTARLEALPFCHDSEELFARLRHLPGAIWLDSGKPLARQGRFDILSALPQITIQSDGDGATITSSAQSRRVAGDPFSIAWQVLSGQGLVSEPATALPFAGGLMGYIDYDLGRYLHKLPPRPARGPAMELGWYGWAIIVDHDDGKCWLATHPACEQAIVERVRETIEEPAAMEVRRPFRLISTFRQDPDRAGYMASVDRINHYIEAGDCYQVNYAVRHSARCEGDPWHAYLSLRRASPAPYGAYLDWNGRVIMSCSPERFLKVAGNQVETIKGTIPRGADPQQDRERAAALMNSDKDRAENLMIVDMLRNDLSRNCATGSVRTPRLFALESFANVHHLVSTVTGQLAADRTPLDLLRDSFPGGSITGAPKRRAMEIIDELEPQPRGIYCGSIGYISATGRMDTNIAIRTVTVESNTVECRGGGGIVADSDPAYEYDEARAKIDILMRALKTGIS